MYQSDSFHSIHIKKSMIFTFPLERRHPSEMVSQATRPWDEYDRAYLYGMDGWQLALDTMLLKAFSIWKKEIDYWNFFFRHIQKDNFDDWSSLVHKKIFSVQIRNERVEIHHTVVLLSVGSVLHSRLNGGIRTSIDEPSSFSILKVLNEWKRQSLFVRDETIAQEETQLTPTYDHSVLIKRRATNIERQDSLLLGEVLVQRHLYHELSPRFQRDWRFSNVVLEEWLVQKDSNFRYVWSIATSEQWYLEKNVNPLNSWGERYWKKKDRHLHQTNRNDCWQDLHVEWDDSDSNLMGDIFGHVG